MTLRHIPDSMNAATVTAIDARLDSVRREHQVAIPLAVESGSRAWGFPSPDSDYDCRFVYVRRRRDYLTLFPKRDVIETPLDRELDLNGWDVAKALKLLLKGNAVVIEWLTSPIIYTADPVFRSDFHALATRLADRDLVARHYLHLGERQRRAYFADGTTIALKKVFYALRPAAALRWLRCHPSEAVAPMNFPTLITDCDAPADVRDLVDDLIARKAMTRELGEGELPAPIGAFIDGEFAAARETFEGGPRPAAPEKKAEAQAFFHATLEKFG
jgi:predicted nucleotidyltransferase